MAPDLTGIPGNQFAVVASQLPGDIDADGDVDFVDLDLFVGVLVGTNANPEHFARSDVNQDGSPNGEDISAFTGAMLP